MRRWFKRPTPPAPAAEAMLGTGAPPQHHPVAPPMTTVVVVAAEADDNSFTIDGVISDEDSAFGPRGWPITLFLKTAETPLLNASLRIMFVRWAHDNAKIGFVLMGAGLRRRVALTDGQSTVYLPVAGC